MASGLRQWTGTGTAPVGRVRGNRLAKADLNPPFGWMG